MNNVTNNQILDEAVVETPVLTKTELYGSKKDSRVKNYRKKQKKVNNTIYKASKAIKKLDRKKYKKVIHAFRTLSGEAKLAAAKMIIRSSKKAA